MGVTPAIYMIPKLSVPTVKDKVVPGKETKHQLESEGPTLGKK